MLYIFWSTYIEVSLKIYTHLVMELIVCNYLSKTYDTQVFQTLLSEFTYLNNWEYKLPKSEMWTFNPFGWQVSSRIIHWSSLYSRDGADPLTFSKIEISKSLLKSQVLLLKCLGNSHLSGYNVVSERCLLNLWFNGSPVWTM